MARRIERIDLAPIIAAGIADGEGPDGPVIDRAANAERQFAALVIFQRLEQYLAEPRDDAVAAAEIFLRPARSRFMSAPTQARLSACPMTRQSSSLTN